MGIIKMHPHFPVQKPVCTVDDSLRAAAGNNDFPGTAFDLELLSTQLHVILQNDPGIGAAFSLVSGKDTLNVSFKLFAGSFFSFDGIFDIHCHLGSAVKDDIPGSIAEADESQ